MRRRSKAMLTAVLGLLMLAGCSQAGVAQDVPPAPPGAPAPTPGVWGNPAPQPGPTPPPAAPPT